MSEEQKSKLFDLENFSTEIGEKRDKSAENHQEFDSTSAYEINKLLFLNIFSLLSLFFFFFFLILMAFFEGL